MTTLEEALQGAAWDIVLLERRLAATRQVVSRLRMVLAKAYRAPHKSLKAAVLASTQAHPDGATVEELLTWCEARGRPAFKRDSFRAALSVHGTQAGNTETRAGKWYPTAEPPTVAVLTPELQERLQNLFGDVAKPPGLISDAKVRDAETDDEAAYVESVLNDTNDDIPLEDL